MQGSKDILNYTVHVGTTEHKVSAISYLSPCFLLRLLLLLLPLFEVVLDLRGELAVAGQQVFRLGE